MSDRAITDDLLARLKRHYIKPGQQFAGGVFVPECGWNGGVQTSRCDALYVGFTGSSGRLLIGHEIKASRADWLHELDQPGKADPWADQCHAWYLVTIPGVVRDGELPAGWGLMLPGKTTTRMQVATPALQRLDRQPSWDAARSIMARLDTLQVGELADARIKARDEAQAKIDERVEHEIIGRLHRDDATRWRTQLDAIDKALGVRVIQGDTALGDDCISTGELARAAAFLRAHRDIERARLELGRHRKPTDWIRRQLDELDEALAGLASSRENEEVPTG